MSLIRHLLQRLGLIRTPTLRKYALDDELELALESLAERERLSPDDLASGLLSEGLARRRLDAGLWQCWQSLSRREQQVAALTCLDYTNPQIAARLGLAVETVRSHTRNVQIKFNVNSKTALRLLLADWDFSDWEARI
ncbi:MAG TPA: LuxR C-terminal-related transcriptional regulator [Anaerolineales bacterium]|jgi:DNA-binding CsgD family transcriptional regulator